MVYMAAYVLALCAPLVVFAVITAVDQRKMTPRGLSRGQRSKLAIEAFSAVLEAQFLVAPGTAVREAQQMLFETTGRAASATPIQLDHESFERLVARLAKAERGKHLISVR